LIPLECYLHRVFPSGFYENTIDRIIDKRIFQPRGDTEEMFLQIPLDWEALDKFEDRNWRMMLQSWGMFHPILNVFDSYSGKEKLVQYFFEIANDWCELYLDDPDDIISSRMPDSYAWYDMSVGYRALTIAFFIDRISEHNLSITDEQKKLIFKLARKHIRHLSNPETTTMRNNHGMFQLHGLMALTQCLGIDNYQKEYNYALSKMEQMAIDQFDENGVHKEHSPHYHIYSLDVFKSIIKGEWYKNCATIEKRIQNAEQITKWLVDPLKRPACIGDSIMTIQTAIDFKSHHVNNEIKNKFLLSDFNDSGYSIIRSRWDADPSDATYLFFMAGYHSKVHKHRDCLSFEWFDQGEKIICDGGKYGYKTNKYRRYALSNKAHNSVEIEGFDIFKMRPYGSALNKTIQLDETTFHLNASLEYNAICHDRSLYLNPGKWLIIYDKLDHQRDRLSTQWFHLKIGYKLRNLKDNRLVFTKGEREIIINCLNKETDVSIYDGDEEIMQGFISEKDYEITPSPAIGFSTGKKKEEIMTIIALSEEFERDVLEYVNRNFSNLDITKLD
jgi:hypothetical protein